MALFVYVDNSNVWIEGQRVSAVAKGLANNIFDAMNTKVVDHTWSYDFGELYRLVCPRDQKIGRSQLFGSRPPASDSLWGWAEREGFSTTVHDRNASNKEKKVDAEIITMMMADSFQYMEEGRDTVVLVASDTDFVPTLQNLSVRGITTKLVFWDHAGRELVASADTFFSLNPYLAQIGRTITSDDED